MKDRCAPPAELQWLSDLIGSDALLRLIELYGGCRVVVPRTINQGSKLAREIGLDAARALAASRGGESFRVPLARAWRVQLYRARGDSYRQIAGRLGITDSRVAELLSCLGMTGKPPLNRKRTAPQHRNT